MSFEKILEMIRAKIWKRLVSIEPIFIGFFEIKNKKEFKWKKF